MFGSNKNFRPSQGGLQGNIDSITDRLLKNKISWESRWNRPVSAVSAHHIERKVSTGDQPTKSAKLSDYLPPSKHLVDTMDKVFAGDRPQKDIVFSSKILSGSQHVNSQRHSTKTLSQEKMSRSQHLQNLPLSTHEIQIVQPLMSSTSKRFFNVLSNVQRDSTFREQIQHMKHSFGKSLTRRKANF